MRIEKSEVLICEEGTDYDGHSIDLTIFGRRIAFQYAVEA